jgi:hypothetical protein
MRAGETMGLRVSSPLLSWGIFILEEVILESMTNLPSMSIPSFSDVAKNKPGVETYTGNDIYERYAITR